MRCLVTCVTVCVLAGSAFSAPPPAAPKEAKTTAEIVKGIESFKGFGVLQSAEFNRADRRIFAVWYCPTSGRATCHLHVYRHDGKKGRWVEHLKERVFHGTHDVSVELPARGGLVVRDFEGEVIFREAKTE